MSTNDPWSLEGQTALVTGATKTRRNRVDRFDDILMLKRTKGITARGACVDMRVDEAQRDRRVSGRRAHGPGGRPLLVEAQRPSERCERSGVRLGARQHLRQCHRPWVHQHGVAPKAQALRLKNAFEEDEPMTKRESGAEMSSSSDPWSLEGQTALVTGATKGIGRAIAEEMAQLGAHVWICARTRADLERCLDEYKRATWTKEKKGGSIEGSVCDVSVAAEREELMGQVAARFSSKLDILVNNAGNSLQMPTSDLLVTALSEMMALNVEAGLHLSRLARPLMKSNGKGSIVFNSTIVASLAAGFQCSAYSMSKAAMNQLARDLAFEWAADNIRVNVVSPGFTDTPGLNRQPMPAYAKQSIEDRIPLRRFADAAEIAHAVVFLCMPAASYITGAIITADGGMTIHASPFPCSQV